MLEDRKTRASHLAMAGGGENLDNLVIKVKKLTIIGE